MTSISAPTTLPDVAAEHEIYEPVDVLDFLDREKREREGVLFEAQGQKPIYASGCGIYSYSSVCSCMGVIARTSESPPSNFFQPLHPAIRTCYFAFPLD